MSAVVQLTFLPSAESKLQTALRSCQTLGVAHKLYKEFITAIAVDFKSAPAGSTFVAACSCSAGVDDIVKGIRQSVRGFETKTGQAPSEWAPIVIQVPTRFTFRQLETELVDRYSQALHSISFGHRGQPRFALKSLPLIRAKTPLSQLISLLKTQNPPLVIIKEAQNLKCPNASDEETRVAWRYLIDIAKDSGVPHLLFGSISSVKEVMDDAALRNAVHLHVLRPYETNQADDARVFLGALNDYDSCLPWSGDESLLKQQNVMACRTGGDVACLRQWILRALGNALCCAGTTLSWENFERTKPNRSQQELAVEEKVHAFEMLGLTFEKAPSSTSKNQQPAPVEGAKPTGSRQKPGTRKLHRDKVNTPVLV